ncbi:hypothetical protein LXL04_003944 [Taraxacum kok-saghyz]
MLSKFSTIPFNSVDHIYTFPSPLRLKHRIYHVSFCNVSCPFLAIDFRNPCCYRSLRETLASPRLRLHLRRPLQRDLLGAHLPSRTTTNDSTSASTAAPSKLSSVLFGFQSRKMKFQYLQTQSQRYAFAGIFVILLPNFFPKLFEPLGHSYPSLFSVRFLSLTMYILCSLLISSHRLG